MPVGGSSGKEHEGSARARGKVVIHHHGEEPQGSSPLCEVLRCLGLHHISKLLKRLLQKGFKATRSTLSNLWFNASTYFFLNPPLILFSINVLIFALVLTFISLYAKVVEVSESGEEWKGFLQSFSKMELCIVPFNQNATLRTATSSPGRRHPSSLGTHSIPISLSISPTSDVNLVPQDFFHLSTTMYGRHIGLEGEHSQAIINVTLSFRRTWNSSACDVSKLIQCRFSDVRGCVSFHAPRNIFPENKHLEHCPKDLTGVNRGRHHHSPYYAGLNWQVPDVNPFYYCRSRSTMKVTFERFLSESNSEKAIEPSARLHLQSMSFVLAFFVVGVFVYAAMFNHSASKHAYHRRISVSSGGDCSNELDA